MSTVKMTLDTIATSVAESSLAGLRAGLMRALRPQLRRRAHATPRRLPAGSITLEARRMVWNELPAGCDIVCEQGALWLTFDHIQRDIVLDPDQTHHCTQATRLGIYALEPSVLRIS